MFAAVARCSLGGAGLGRGLVDAGILMLVLASGCSEPRNVGIENSGGASNRGAGAGGAGGAPPAVTAPVSPHIDAATTATDGAADVPAVPSSDAQTPVVMVDAPTGRPGGAGCVASAECASGVCDDGLCCLRTCAACERCSGAGGACQPLAAGAEDQNGAERCPTGQICDGLGRCAAKIGAACVASPDCASGFCAQGICCTSVCNETCETCAGPSPGVCTEIEAERDSCATYYICVGRGGCGVVDQRQDNESGGNATILGVKRAQVVTMGVGPTSKLVAFRVKLDCAAAARLTVDITETVGGRPGGTPLASATVDGGRLKLHDGFVLVRFTSPPVIPLGRAIALTLLAEGAECRVTTYGGFEQIDPYPRGGSFVLQAGQWQAMEGDLAFQTLIMP
jgi:hypothetical protein